MRWARACRTRSTNSRQTTRVVLPSEVRVVALLAIGKRKGNDKLYGGCLLVASLAAPSLAGDLIRGGRLRLLSP